MGVSPSDTTLYELLLHQSYLFNLKKDIFTGKIQVIKEVQSDLVFTLPPLELRFHRSAMYN